MEKKKPTVMIIEDETLLLEAITKKLTLNNLDAVACFSGKEAFDYLERSETLPDIIWLDYYLKDIDGVTFMRELKKNDRWKDIPVMVVSNSASPEKISIMEGLGVEKYLLKAEYRLDQIIPIIQEMLQKK